jgi:hypothetical protein
MICPHCKSNLEGALIYDTFLEMYSDPEVARETAALYGATETEGRWGREIGLYSMANDRTTDYQCPDCGGTWPRGC